MRVSREQAELVLAELLELAPGGVQEIELGDQLVEYAVFGAPGELPALPDLRAAAGGALVDISTSEIADDWAERWREFHRPLVLDRKLTVRPPWEPPGDTAVDLVIDPGRAFGTGAHPTTRMCLELMLGLSPEGSFLDLGCGSGVLAIAAARLGFSPVVALDNDPACVGATRENAILNGVELEVERRDLRAGAVPAAHTAVANLLRPLLLSVAKRLGSEVELPDRLIVSGLLRTEANEVAAAFAAAGLVESERRSDRDWSALLLERTTG